MKCGVSSKSTIKKESKDTIYSELHKYASIYYGYSLFINFHVRPIHLSKYRCQKLEGLICGKGRQLVVITIIWKRGQANVA